jgi:hypothetical protein
VPAQAKAATTRGAATRLRLASLAEAQEALVAQAVALEVRVGANSASAEEDATYGASKATGEAGTEGKEGKNQPLAVVHLAAGNREATDATEFFAALTGCLGALSGMRAEALDDAADDTTAGKSSGVEKLQPCAHLTSILFLGD